MDFQKHHISGSEHLLGLTDWVDSFKLHPPSQRGFEELYRALLGNLSSRSTLW